MAEPEQEAPPVASTPAAQQALVKYKDAIDQTATGVWEPERMALPSLDPMRPGDTTVSITANPPMCPMCHAKGLKVFLYPFSQNTHGDIYFQCLNSQQMNICGYEAIYRIGPKTFEQHPQKAQREDWISPARLYNRQPVKTEETKTIIEAPEGCVSIAEAAELLGVEKSILTGGIVMGQVETMKHESKTFIPMTQVELLLAEKEADEQGESWLNG